MSASTIGAGDYDDDDDRDAMDAMDEMEVELLSGEEDGWYDDDDYSDGRNRSGVGEGTIGIEPSSGSAPPTRLVALPPARPPRSPLLGSPRQRPAVGPPGLGRGPGSIVPRLRPVAQRVSSERSAAGEGGSPSDPNRGPGRRRSSPSRMPCSA